MRSAIELGGFHALDVLWNVGEQVAAATPQLPPYAPECRLQEEIQRLLDSETPAGSALYFPPKLHPGDLQPIAQKTWAVLLRNLLLECMPSSSLRIFDAHRLKDPCLFRSASRPRGSSRREEGVDFEDLYDIVTKRPSAHLVVEGTVRASQFELLCTKLISLRNPFQGWHLNHVPYLLAGACDVMVDQVVAEHAGQVMFRFPSPSLGIARLGAETGARALFTKDFLDADQRKRLLTEAGFVPVPLNFYSLLGPFDGLDVITLGPYANFMHPLCALYTGVWNMRNETNYY